MTDALRLGGALVASIQSVEENAMDKAVQGFEEDMFQRAAVVAAVSKANMEDMFSNDGMSDRTAPVFVRRMVLGHLPWLEKLIPIWLIRLALRMWFKW